MVTSVFLNTRGRERHRDYQFLGAAPPVSWWRDYADHTTFERPTILVQSDGAAWQAYVSGIPSRRRDAVGTVIRYTLVLAGSPGVVGGSGDGEAGGIAAGDVLALVSSWLADQDHVDGDRRVSTALDAAFPEPDVERLIDIGDGEGAEEVRAEVSRRVGMALQALEMPGPLEAPPAAGDWLGDVDEPASRAAFVQRVDALLTGKPGRALVLNLVGSPADVTALVDDARPLAVLAPDLPDPSTITVLGPESAGPGETRSPKKALPPPRTSSPVSASSSVATSMRGCMRLILVVPIALLPIVLVLALALALLGGIFLLR